MKRRHILKTLAVVAIGTLFILGSAVPVAAQAGPYKAKIDLGPLGFGPRIEVLGVILHESGAVTFMSEHETDKESAGVGIWKDLGGGVIGLGVFSFRYGPDPASSICGLVMVNSPPGNCLLKVGGMLTRTGKNGKTLVGTMLLTIKKIGGKEVVFPDDLPITMKPLTLKEFAGALP